jgi:hypothetical protein
MEEELAHHHHPWLRELLLLWLDLLITSGEMVPGSLLVLPAWRWHNGNDSSRGSIRSHSDELWQTVFPPLIMHLRPRSHPKLFALFRYDVWGFRCRCPKKSCSSYTFFQILIAAFLAPRVKEQLY